MVENGGKECGELLFDAQTLLNTVETFVSYYAVDEDGNPYTTVDESNYDWILTAEEEWDSLTDVEREAINNKVKELCGMTFDEMLAKAAKVAEGSGDGSGEGEGEGDQSGDNSGDGDQSDEEEIPSPEDGVPFPTVALVGLFLGGAAMIVGKKRRDEE